MLLCRKNTDHPESVGLFCPFNQLHLRTWTSGRASWTLCGNSSISCVSHLCSCHTISLTNQKTDWSLNYPPGSSPGEGGQQCSTNPQWQEVHAGKSETCIKTRCSTLNPHASRSVSIIKTFWSRVDCLLCVKMWWVLMCGVQSGGQRSALWGLRSRSFPPERLPGFIFSPWRSVTESSWGRSCSEPPPGSKSDRRSAAWRRRQRRRRRHETCREKPRDWDCQAFFPQSSAPVGFMQHIFNSSEHFNQTQLVLHHLVLMMHPSFQWLCSKLYHETPQFLQTENTGQNPEGTGLSTRGNLVEKDPVRVTIISSQFHL